MSWFRRSPGDFVTGNPYRALQPDGSAHGHDIMPIKDGFQLAALRRMGELQAFHSRVEPCDLTPDQESVVRRLLEGLDAQV